METKKAVRTPTKINHLIKDAVASYPEKEREAVYRSLHANAADWIIASMVDYDRTANLVKLSKVKKFNRYLLSQEVDAVYIGQYINQECAKYGEKLVHYGMAIPADVLEVINAHWAVFNE